MKIYLILFLMLGVSNASTAQNLQNEQLVKDVVLAFQADFNEGGFKNTEF